jgi:hypothetical protein
VFGFNLAHVRICGGCCRGSDTPASSLTVPRQPLKRQIKQLHPSCSSGELKGLSKKGILRIEAILAFFCQVLWSARLACPGMHIFWKTASNPGADAMEGAVQALVQQVSGIGITSGLATISDASLASSTECGIENLKVRESACIKIFNMRTIGAQTGVRDKQSLDLAGSIVSSLLAR